MGTSDEALAQGLGLIGNFKQACQVLGAYSSSSTLGYQNSIQTGTTQVYMDTTCMSVGYSYTIAGAYQTAGAANAPAGAQKLDVTLQTMTLVPLSSQGVTALNGASFCGISTWTLNTPVDISGRDCGGKTYTTAQVIHTIFKLNGDTLLMGQVASAGSAGDGTSDVNRPLALGLPFVRY